MRHLLILGTLVAALVLAMSATGIRVTGLASATTSSQTHTAKTTGPGTKKGTTNGKGGTKQCRQRGDDRCCPDTTGSFRDSNEERCRHVEIVFHPCSAGEWEGENGERRGMRREDEPCPFVTTLSGNSRYRGVQRLLVQPPVLPSSWVGVPQIHAGDLLDWTLNAQGLFKIQISHKGHTLARFDPRMFLSIPRGETHLQMLSTTGWLRVTPKEIRIQRALYATVFRSGLYRWCNATYSDCQ